MFIRLRMNTNLERVCDWEADQAGAQMFPAEHSKHGGRQHCTGSQQLQPHTQPPTTSTTTTNIVQAMNIIIKHFKTWSLPFS